MKLKVELEHQYEEWQNIIDIGEATIFTRHELRESAEQNKKNLEDKIEKARAKFLSEENVIEKSFASLREELDQFEDELNQKLNNFDNQIFQQTAQMWREMYLEVEELADSDEEQQQGLTFQTIQQFETFQANQYFVND